STADPGGSPRPVAAAATSFAGPHSAARLGGGPRPPGHECDPVSPGISAAVSAPEHRGRQPQLYGGGAKFITWSVVFILFILPPLLSAFSVKPQMLSSGQDSRRGFSPCSSAAECRAETRGKPNAL